MLASTFSDKVENRILSRVLTSELPCVVCGNADFKAVPGGPG